MARWAPVGGAKRGAQTCGARAWPSCLVPHFLQLSGHENWSRPQKGTHTVLWSEEKTTTGQVDSAARDTAGAPRRRRASCDSAQRRVGRWFGHIPRRGATCCALTRSIGLRLYPNRVQVRLDQFADRWLRRGARGLPLQDTTTRWRWRPMAIWPVCVTLSLSSRRMSNGERVAAQPRAGIYRPVRHSAEH